MVTVIKIKSEEANVIYLLTSNQGIPFLYVNKYLQFRDTVNKSSNTIKSYAYRLKLYWAFIELNQLDFEQISMNLLVKYIGWLQRGSSIGTKKREPNTINSNVMAVFGFDNYLARFHSEILNTKLDFYSETNKKSYSYKSFLEHTKSSVKYRLNALKLREVKKPYSKLSEEQLKEIFQAKINIRNKLMDRILYDTEVRISEALNIKLVCQH